MRYELFYWPGIQGRGEYVRLALEDAGADYLDVGRGSPDQDLGVPALEMYLSGDATPRPPFAPPFLKAGDLVISHVANILQFLAPRLGLIGEQEDPRIWAHGLQLTLTDFIAEIHDVHHPLSSTLYYEEQRDEALRRADLFRRHRLPRFLEYFEQVLEQNPRGAEYLVGDEHSYVDLSLFQTVLGLRYAFPRAIGQLDDDLPKINALVARVAERPRVRAYLDSERRQPFNEDGIFRHYPELDGEH
ncbi:glutathione S-transferase family protein [Alloalcanivorax gelatiniphagus]|uniref:Glutathione S-transferase n=1 Tax=Alloalcanivorax gelatiniphagus TaxID=1194167 RepID=A0ABY2XJB2_9GAMM|nr:glutathione S-transferase [Alloalcanivorax gelatiniphagus]TMW11988.1 glutathione S-transferase [Alloalcanivorax gelatiniphagus]|tara:strand:+ start:8286 stop:9020 length:735 start_codon:yes stop_codon:yes gene_type:complete